MPERRCESCKFFEPAPVEGKGWCRTSTLYSPQQSHSVDPRTLDCSGRYGNFWEAANGARLDEYGTGDAGAALSKPRRLRLFELAPQLIPVAAGGLMSSSLGGGSGSDRDPSRTPGRVPNSGTGSGRGLSSSGPTRTGVPQGQERSVSYSPEDRYWTDYLRIALPVIGLLLMLGLFWYWASAVIGDDNGSPQQTPSAVAQVITQPASTATATQQVTLPLPTAQLQVTNTPAAGSGNNSGGDGGATDVATESASAGKDFKVGDIVIVNDDNVNMRDTPSVDGAVVTTLSNGDELTVTKVGEASGDYVFVGVDDSNGNSGFVADKFLDAS